MWGNFESRSGPDYTFEKSLHDVGSFIDLPLVVFSSEQRHHTFLQINSLLPGQCRPTDCKERNPDLVGNFWICMLQLREGLKNISDFDLTNFLAESLAIRDKRLEMVVHDHTLPSGVFLGH